MPGYTFISYAHENTRFALKLARHLRERGVVVWLDQWQSWQNEAWDKSIKNALKGCSHFLPVLSPEAVNSWLVRDQTMLAVREGKPIVPVLYQPCVLPPTLRNLPIVDFSGGQFQQALAELLVHLPPTAGADSEANVDRARTAWGKLRRHPLLIGTGLALIVALLALGWVWPRYRAERFVAPVEVAPVEAAEPVLVPTIEWAVSVNPLPTPINTYVRPQDGKVMVLVPGGEFLMGSDDSDLAASEDEKPQRLFYLGDYWIDKTEINNMQYRQCEAAGACTPPQALPKIFLDDLLPVVGVSWEQAQDYCQWAGGQLPSEAQWEKAARGVDGRLYPWGNEFNGSRLNHCDVNCVADWRDQDGDDGHRYTAPTGSYPTGASPYGALDMSGNVWEWTADWYDSSAYATASYANPTGPEQGLQRVIRGGSWLYQGASLRVARRHRDVPTSSYDNIGFRCVLPAQELLPAATPIP